MRRFSLIPAALCAILLTGCAHYEFDLTRPQELARHVGDDEQTSLMLDPLEYRLQSAEGRLVIKIFNPTNDTIQLLGRMSSVVDPDGESHPLSDRAIPPGSYAKLILPPLRPQLQPAGPVIGIGIASSSGTYWGPGWYGYDEKARYDPYDKPRYYDVYDAGNPVYWDWGGETDVRLSLVYHRGSDQIKHEFTFHRKRM